MLKADYWCLRPTSRESIFGRLKQAISVRMSSLSHSFSARWRRAHVHGRAWMYDSVSPDCHLILCRYRQRRVLSWVVRSLKFDYLKYVAWYSNFVCGFVFNDKKSIRIIYHLIYDLKRSLNLSYNICYLDHILHMKWIWKFIV